MSKIILQINATANDGSTGKILEAIGNQAYLSGWKVYAAYGRDSRPSSLNLIRVGSYFNPYFHYIVNRFLDMEGLASRVATKKLINQIQSIQPDIIHLHNIHDHWLNYKILFSYINNTNIKVVWTFHDCWAFTGHCYHFIDKGCYKWENHCSNCPSRNRFRDNSFRNFELKKELFTQNKNLTIVAVSEWMASFVKKSFFKEKRLKVIHNGIDVSIFKPTDKSNVKRQNFNLLAVSNVWTKSKGLYDIFRLREILSDEYEITIVGLSREQLRQVPRGIDAIGRTGSVQELVSLYNRADVFINPTYADTFPTVNLEALACGTPVITYKTGGSPEAVDENSGIVIPQGDVQALADAVCRIKESPLSSMECRLRALNCFDKEKCFSQYISLYEDLINNK